MSTLTDKLGMSKPEDGDTSWGDEIRGALDTIDSALISFYFGENVAGHSGLDFAYLGGIYRKGNALVSISGSIITLTDDDINYVFINTTTSSVAVNQTGVVLGDIALFEVVTTSGAITTVTDVRSLLSADVTVPHTHNNLLDETAHDLLDHTGLTGIPSTAGLLDVVAHDLLDHTGLTGCGGNPVTNGKEVALDSINETTIATRTPAAAANVMVGIYFRVITATTTVTAKITYTDATGAQTNTLLDAQSCAVGSYSLPMLMINSTAAAIAVKITAGTANQVYGSATIMEVV